MNITIQGNNVITPKSNRVTFRGTSEPSARLDQPLFDSLNKIDDDKNALMFIRQLEDLVSPIDKENNHIIHSVTRKNFYETLKYMLLNPKRALVLLELTDGDNKTPLAVTDNLKIAKLMLSKGANLYAVDNLGNPAGMNPILPQDLREKVKTTLQNKGKVIPLNPQIPEISELNKHAAEKAYNDVVQEIPAEEKTIKETTPKKSFFSVFSPKNETTQNEPQEVQSTSTEVKSKVTEQIEQVGKSADEIEIPGTCPLRRVETKDFKGLEDIVGLENVKKSIKASVIDPILNENIKTGLEKNKTTIPNGLLLVAPAGNGKSSLVKAIGAEAKLPVFEVKNAQEVEDYVDKIYKNFKNTKQRAIIYLRGIDNLYPSQDANGELTNLLARSMSDTAKKGSLVIVSAESSDNIPREIITPGKVDRILRFKSPDFDARKLYLEKYTEGKEVLSEVIKPDNIKIIADKTQGFSIAQLKHIIDETVIAAMTDGKNTIEMSDFLEKLKIFSKEQNIPEINEYNKTSIYDTTLRRYQPTDFDAKDFDSIAGMKETKSSVEDSILKMWRSADKLREQKIQLPAGGVFVGDPGTSKTYMAKGIARSLNLPLYILKMSEVGSSYVHETSRNMGKIIDQLITKFDETGEASVLLMDEIDHFQKGNSQHGTEEVNTLLQEVERGRNKILFLGTTNEFESLPDSLTRDGRMGAVIHFEHCDSDAAKAIIKNMLDKRKDVPEIHKLLQNEELLTKLSAKCDGMVAASVSSIVNDALANSLINNTNIEKAFDDEIETRKQKDVEKMLSKNSRESGRRLNITKDSTLMYDTYLQRYVPTPQDAQDFESIAGMKQTKNSVESSILTPWKNAEKLSKYNIQLPVGGVFVGDPGTSKTYMAKAIARSLDIPLYTLKMSEEGTSLAHETSRNIGKIIDQLVTKYDKTGEPSVLLIDEIDYFQKNGNQSSAEEVNTLLQEIERARNKVLFIGTTNEFESLPDSLTRDGRMGTVIHFEHCDSEAAKAIIKNMLNKRKDIPEVSKILDNPELLNKISKRCDGMVAASVSAIVNDSLSESVIKNIPLDKAIENAVDVRRKKDIEKMLSKNCKDAGHRLNLSDNTTVMYDTKFPRVTSSRPINFETLGGMQDVKDILREEIIDVYKPDNYKLMKENNLPVSKGFILWGPPGCGKTSIVMAAANEMNIPVYKMNSGNVGDSLIHSTSRNAAQYREQLAYKFKMTGERSLLFMDEAQQLVPRTSGSVMSHSHNIEETNFIKEMMMTAEEDGIIYAMATNDINQIEPAFYENTDRLGVKIYVGYPDVQSRKSIIKNLLETRPIANALNNDESISKLAQCFDNEPIGKISQSILNIIRDSIRYKKPITLETALKTLKNLR